jgi:HK97 family phage portal protein
MSIFNWIRGRRGGLMDGGFWASWFGTGTWTGKSVTPQSALNISAWWRCTKLYAEVAGSLPLKFYERGEGDERKSASEHDIARLIAADPNDELTSWEFWGAHAAALCTGGNAYAEKGFAGDRLIRLEPISPEFIQPYREQDGVLRYKLWDRGKEEILPAEKIFHTRGFSFTGDVGLSPLAYARQTLGIALATEESTGRAFSQGMRASGIFTLPEAMTPEQRKQFKDNYIAPAEGAENEGKSLVLPPGFKWQPVSIAPKDAEMLLSRRFNVEDVCRWMGVPPILAGHAAEGQTMWGSGVEQIMLAWLALGLDSFLSNIERSINKRLLKPEERARYYAEYDRNGLLRADSEARGEFISKMVGSAQMTPNEGRKKDNRPPLPGGDQLFINSTFIPLTSAGQRPSTPPTSGIPAKED